MKYYIDKTKNYREDPFFDSFFFPFVKEERNTLTMRTDIKETDNAYEFEVDVPGIKKENLSIEIEDGYLTIAYNHQEEKHDEGKKFVRKERYYSSTERSFYVGDVEKDNIEANYVNGVLKIVVPKLVEKKKETKRIEIK